MSTTHRDRAVSLLVNYFEAIARKAGMKWDADYTTEIGEAVDAIIDPLEARLASLERHLDNEVDPKIAGLEDRLDTPNWKDRR
jgi:hypothetical protein